MFSLLNLHFKCHKTKTSVNEFFDFIINYLHSDVGLQSEMSVLFFFFITLYKLSIYNFVSEENDVRQKCKHKIYQKL